MRRITPSSHNTLNVPGKALLCGTVTDVVTMSEEVSLFTVLVTVAIQAFAAEGSMLVSPASSTREGRSLEQRKWVTDIG